jgi:hypothetical protein
MRMADSKSSALYQVLLETSRTQAFNWFSNFKSGVTLVNNKMPLEWLKM